MDIVQIQQCVASKELLSLKEDYRIPIDLIIFILTFLIADMKDMNFYGLLCKEMTLKLSNYYADWIRSYRDFTNNPYINGIDPLWEGFPFKLEASALFQQKVLNQHVMSHVFNRLVQPRSTLQLERLLMELLRIKKDQNLDKKLYPSSSIREYFNINRIQNEETFKALILTMIWKGFHDPQLQDFIIFAFDSEIPASTNHYQYFSQYTHVSDLDVNLLSFICVKQNNYLRRMNNFIRILRTISLESSPLKSFIDYRLFIFDVSTSGIAFLLPFILSYRYAPLFVCALSIFKVWDIQIITIFFFDHLYVYICNTYLLF